MVFTCILSLNQKLSSLLHKLRNLNYRQTTKLVCTRVFTMVSSITVPLKIQILMAYEARNEYLLQFPLDTSVIEKVKGK